MEEEGEKIEKEVTGEQQEKIEREAMEKERENIVREVLEEEEKGEEREKGRVCVTGAGGFLGSWLVKLLLSKGYKVHATVRDPSNGKNSHLKSFKEAPENLQLFQAELLDYDALSAAISGCEGVFHAATPIPSAKVPNPELDVIAPAVTGTLNILKACTEAKVKRVVIVSSTAAVQVNPGWPQDRIKDEDCWSDKEFCKKIENWYCLSKTMAEEAAWEYAKENEIDVITVCPSMVFGPLLQPTVNVSSSFLISIIQGGREPTENILFHFADVRDVADALLLVYEKPEASGRYICAPHPSNLQDLVEKLKTMYPNYNYQSYTEADQDALMTSEKLKRLGWNCRTLEETLADTVEYYRDIGGREPTENILFHFADVWDVADALPLVLCIPITIIKAIRRQNKTR